VGVEDDAWHWFAFLREGDTLELYVDGSTVVDDDTDTSNSDTLASDGIFYVGRYYNVVKGFKGAIDDIRVFDRALTEIEIEGLFAGGAGTPDCWGPIGLPFTPGSSDDAIIR